MNAFNQFSSRKTTIITPNNKILPANKVEKNKLLNRLGTTNGLLKKRNHKDKERDSLFENKSINNNTNHIPNFLSYSPTKKNTYVESLKDKIFSPGDFNQSKNESKSVSLIAELTKQFLNTSTPQISKSKPLIDNQKPTSNHHRVPSIIKYLPEKSYSHVSRKTLFLDLDETLVHSAFKPFYAKSDIVLDITFDQKSHTIHVLKRPNVDEFLERMAKIFELVIFTASIPEYANPLLNKLDPHQRITSRLFREHCTASGNLFIKDLKKVGRHLKDVILLDNNPVSYALNKENGLPILTWHSNQSDNELMKMIPLLEYLSRVDDVRIPIQKVVANNYVNYFEVNRLINPNKEKNGDDSKTNQTMVSYSGNNANEGSAANYSMNLFSHQFSSFYFDEKDKKSKDISKDKKLDNGIEKDHDDKDKTKDKDKQLDLFNNFFENKKGSGNLFEDKKYQEKYDKFYDIKEKVNKYKKEVSNEIIIQPLNTYLKQNKERLKNNEKEKESNKHSLHNNRKLSSPLGHNESLSSIKKHNDLTALLKHSHHNSINRNNGSINILCGSNNNNDNNQESVNAQTSRQTNLKNYINQKKDKEEFTILFLNPNEKTSHSNYLSKSIERNKFDMLKGNTTQNGMTQGTTNGFSISKKATISLLDQTTHVRQLSNWNQSSNTSNGSVNNINFNRNSSQSLRERYNGNSIGDLKIL